MASVITLLLLVAFTATIVTIDAASGCVESKLIKGKTVKGKSTLTDTIEECLEHCRQIEACVAINYNTKKKCNPKTRQLRDSDETNSLWTYCPRDEPEPEVLPPPEPEVEVLPPPEPEVEVLPPPKPEVLPPPRPEVLPPPRPEVLPPAPGSTVNCGGHEASSCADCPEGNGAAWCNGECSWSNDQCVLKGAQGGGVSCGGHDAPSCADCPQGNGKHWCNGDCYWKPKLLLFGDCLPKEELTTNCGGHKAVSCKQCPQGKGAAWCNGDCTWVKGGLFAFLGAGECKPK